MKVRSARKIPQANKMFTDREEPRQTFWKQYNLMKSQIDNIADIKVISFYGIGGVGKSSLLKKIIEELEDKVNTPNYTYFDLGVMNESKAVLEGMRNKLSEDYKYSFPIFDLALYTYARKIGKTPESAEIKTFASKSPFLSLVMDVGQLLPGIETISKIIATADKGVTYVRNVLNNHRKEITEMETMSADELYAKLPYLFSLDMSDNLKNAKEPFVVFLDTYEKLVNEMSSIGEPLNNDLWLRDENGLIQNIPNVLWVIAGREKLKWTRFDTEWNDALEQHILGSLSYTDASNFLYHAGIKDNSLIADIYELTHGIPIYLDLCVDRYISVSQTKTPTINDFGKDTFTLIERFVRYMDDSKKDIVYMLSCLGIWEEELISKIASKIIPNFSITSYEKVKDFSFLSESSDGIFTIHQTVSEVLFSSCPDIIKTRTVENALEYYISKLNSTELFAERFSFYLDMAVKMSLLKYPNNDDYFDYYKENLNDIFEDLSNACKFDIINNSFEHIFKRAEKEPKSKLYALSLRAKARFIMYEGKYKESIPYAEESIKIFENTFGENNEDTLESKFRLGWCLFRQGMYKEANELANKIYEQCVSLKGEDDILSVKILNLKAITLDSLGKYEEALKLEKIVVEKRTEILGEDHLDTSRAMNNLAVTLNSLGRYEESLSLRKQVLEKRTETLGEYHPDTIRAMSSLATTLNSLGRYEESLSLRKQVLEKRTEILGEYHPNTISAINQVAWTYYCMEKFQEGLPYAEKLLTLIGKSDTHNKNRLTRLDTIVLIFAETGKIEQALHIAEEITGESENQYYDIYDFMGDRYKTMGIVLAKAGEYNEAVAYFNKALERYSRSGVKSKEIDECKTLIEKYEQM